MGRRRRRSGSTLTVTDQFAGCGGSSLGASQAAVGGLAGGVEVVLAMNHWKLAVDTHQANFPNTDHVCADVSSTDPRRYVSTDILITSPECRYHSIARSKPRDTGQMSMLDSIEADRSRATMWDVPRFAEHHDYKAIVVENVVEVTKWAPYESWLLAMHSLGYEHKLVCLNSMTAHPTPQSRDRIYVVFWKRGNRAPDLEYTPPCWCGACEAEVAGYQAWKRPGNQIGKYRQQYVYRCPQCQGEAFPFVFPAAAAIDWSLPTPRIGDRERPLAEATRRRVALGLQRFGGSAVVQFAGNTFERPGYVRAWSTNRPMVAQTATLSHGLAVEPFIVQTTYSAGRNRHPRGVSGPLPTQTTQLEHGLAVPFIAELRGGSSGARSVEDPLGTVTAAGNHHGLVVPCGGTWNQDARPTDEPVRALTTREAYGLALVPTFYVKNYGKGDDASMAHALSDPLGAVTTVDHHAVVAVPFTVNYNGTGRPHPVNQPLGTQPTRDRHALVEPSGDLSVDDCGFRMLEPHEIQRAMAFPDDYKILGTKRQKVRQLGHAVTPPAMKHLIGRIAASLA